MKGSFIFSRSAQVLKPHIPLIKFRKGGQEQIGGLKKTSGTAGHKQESHIRVIEDFQLPLRFRRLPLGENEINAINSGGCL